MESEGHASLAAAEPSVTAFEASARSIDGREVALDRTYFYPESGGQPADRGTLGGVDVADVRRADGTVVHELASEPTFEVGETVAGRVDADFRTYCRRAHTASHVVYGAGRELLDGHGYAGFDIGGETVRLDFETETDPSAVDPSEIQRLAGAVVWDARPVEWYEMDVGAARADDAIVFNLGEEDGDLDVVRIVEIDDWDVSACGGTHVRNTSEIGPIEVVDVSNPGAGRLRVEFAVGPTALDHRRERDRASRSAARALDTNVADLPARAERLRSTNQALREERDSLRVAVVESRLARLAADANAEAAGGSEGGDDWLVGTVEGVGADAVADGVRDATPDAGVVALAGRDGSTFVVVASDGAVDAADLVAEATDEFGGGGGGGPTFAQGGGMDVDPETVVEALRERT